MRLLGCKTCGKQYSIAGKGKCAFGVRGEENGSEEAQQPSYSRSSYRVIAGSRMQNRETGDKEQLKLVLTGWYFF